MKGEGRARVEKTKETDYTDNQVVIWEKLGVGTEWVEGWKWPKRSGVVASDRQPES